MGISLLRRHKGPLSLAVLAAGIVALLLLLVAAGGGGPAPAQAAAKHHAKRLATHHAKRLATHHAIRHHSSARHAQAPTDADNVQSGDQTTPDLPGTAGAESSSENESTVESEAGQPGEPANGHEDAPGQNTDCTGDCVQ